ncbi:MAG: TlpA disulfide reductase family protein [Pseudomonadota bacterium]|nr:TlpA disulfide reductase family protein [Pseudomonadota bacterium]
MRLAADDANEYVVAPMSPPPPDDDELRVRSPDEPPSEPPSPLSRRAGRLVRELAITLGALLLLWVGFGWLRAPDLPRMAPDFDLADLDGGRHTLADLRGQTVVLNFWATWCGPCRMEVPGLSAFARAHPDIPVLGIAVDGEAGALRKAAAELGLDYLVLRADVATRTAYGVSTLPTTVIVRPDGTVRSAHTGLMLQPHLWWLTR